MNVQHSDRAGGQEKLLSVADLAERFQVPIATIYRWNSRGEGPRRIAAGKHCRYRLADVLAWEEEHLVPEQA